MIRFIGNVSVTHNSATAAAGEPMFLFKEERSAVQLIGPDASIEMDPTTSMSVKGGVTLIGQADGPVFGVDAGTGTSKVELSCKGIAIINPTVSKYPIWTNKSSQNQLYISFYNCFVKSYNGLPIMLLTGDGHEMTFIARDSYFGATGDGDNAIFDWSNCAFKNVAYAGQAELRNNIFEIDANATLTTDGGVFQTSIPTSSVAALWIVNTGNNRFQSWSQATVQNVAYRIWYDLTPYFGARVIFQNDSPSIANYSPFTSPGIVATIGVPMLGNIKLRPSLRINKS